MILIISLALTAVCVLLFGKALRAHPAVFYVGAAVLSALVIAIYWLAPDFVSLSVRGKLPVWLGALGTAGFVFVMYAGALPNGHRWMKRIMPIRGELSICACLLTLGHNLSYGKNYLTPGYLFSGPVSATKIAAWISAVLIVLMLILTVTSFKAVRRKFQPKSWKALQRWAYLFYALVYIHVLLLTVPNVLKGRSSYLTNLLVYSLVFLSYAVCRVQKAVLQKRGRRVTGRRQLAGAGIGVLLSLVLTAGVMLPGMLPAGQTADEPAPVISDQAQPEETPNSDESGEMPGTEDAADEPELPAADEMDPVGNNAADTVGQEVQPGQPEPEPSVQPSTEPVPEPTPEALGEPSPEPSPEPSAEPSPAPTPVSKYRDGVFTGTGEGYYGPVTVLVTISSDRITAVSVLSHEDDPEYMNDAANGVTASVLLLQSANVSAVSGATYSSEGIMDAVSAALREAEN